MQVLLSTPSSLFYSLSRNGKTNKHPFNKVKLMPFLSFDGTAREVFFRGRKHSLRSTAKFTYFAVKMEKLYIKAGERGMGLTETQAKAKEIRDEINPFSLHFHLPKGKSLLFLC